MREMKKSIKEDTIVMSNDNGMGSNKVTYGLNGVYYQFDFPSKFEEVKKQTPDTRVINGKIYNFEEGRIAAAHGHRTKDNEIHEVLLKKAVHEVYKRTGATKFDVIVNCSLDSYKDDKGEKVLNSMSKEKTIKVKELYTDEVELTINRIECYPECLTGGALAKVNFKEEDVIVIDFGTKDLQLIRVIQGSPNYAGSKSMKIGMDYIYRGMVDTVANLGVGINDDVAIKMYLEKTANGKTSIIDSVDDKMLEYLMSNIFTEIDRCLTEMNMSKFTKIVLLGGGSMSLKRFLDTKFIKEDEIEVYYVEEGYFANSLALFKKAERLYGYEKHISEKEQKEKEQKAITTTTPKRTRKSTSDKKEKKETNPKDTK